MRNGCGTHSDTNIYLSPKKAFRRAYVCSFFAVKFCFSSSYKLLGYKIIENQNIYLISNSLLKRNSHHELFKRLNDFFQILKTFQYEKLFFNIFFCIIRTYFFYLWCHQTNYTLDCFYSLQWMSSFWLLINHLWELFLISRWL